MTWQQLIMYLVGIGLIYLGIKKKLEPALLIPLGFGAILVNLPGSSCGNGIIQWLFEKGIQASEAMPILLFIGIGAMLDFTPLMKNPILFLCGLFAQAGIFIAIILARKLGFALNDAISIGIIGAADGPTAILVSKSLNSQYSGQITLAAYSYIALIPLIQPFVAKFITTSKERKIPAQAINQKQISIFARIAFPIAVTFITGFISPHSAQLVGFSNFFPHLSKSCQRRGFFQHHPDGSGRCQCCRSNLFCSHWRIIYWNVLIELNPLNSITLRNSINRTICVVFKLCNANRTVEQTSPRKLICMIEQI